MEITGRIIAVLPVQGGISQKRKRVGKNRNMSWKHMTNTLRKYASRFSVQTASIRQPYSPEKNLQYFFDIDSREYQGRWFTNINAWKVERPMAAAPQSAPGAMTPENVVPASAPAASAVPDFGPANPIDDLPF